jgi:hypothetical protein
MENLVLVHSLIFFKGIRCKKYEYHKNLEEAFGNGEEYSVNFLKS